MAITSAAAIIAANAIVKHTHQDLTGTSYNFAADTTVVGGESIQVIVLKRLVRHELAVVAAAKAIADPHKRADRLASAAIICGSGFNTIEDAVRYLSDEAFVVASSRTLLQIVHPHLRDALESLVPMIANNPMGVAA